MTAKTRAEKLWISLDGHAKAKERDLAKIISVIKEAELRGARLMQEVAAETVNGQLAYLSDSTCSPYQFKGATFMQKAIDTIRDLSIEDMLKGNEK